MKKKNISYFLERDVLHDIWTSVTVSDSLRLWDCHQEQHKDSQRILTDHISVVAFVTKLKVLVGESESGLDQMLIQLPAMISQDYQVLAQLRLHCQIWTCKSGSKAGPGGRCGRDNWTDLNKNKSSIETENSTLFFSRYFIGFPKQALSYMCPDIWKNIIQRIWILQQTLSSLSTGIRIISLDVT